MVQGSSYTLPTLQRELMLAHVVRGDFEPARHLLETTTAVARPLATDPLVIHIVDCHDCDRAAYDEKSQWTDRTYVTKLVQLKTQASGSGEDAAKAAFLLANGLYNMTYYGNARQFLDGSHSVTADTTQAESWYKKAFDSSKDRNFKAKAAFMAAKCELAQALQREDPQLRLLHAPLPIPKRWFPVVKSFADTKYHREILQECGHYKTWYAR